MAAAVATLPIVQSWPHDRCRQADVNHNLELGSWLTERIIYPVLEFLPIKEQMMIIFKTSRMLKTFFRSSDIESECWAHLTVSLCVQKQLYLPSEVREQTVLVSGRGGWKKLFDELWPLRHRFVADRNQIVDSAGVRGEEKPRLRLATYCRFRPATSSKLTSNSEPSSRGSTVVLPLSQRVALLRRSHPDLSAREAVQKVMFKSYDSKEHDRTEIAQNGEHNEKSPTADGFSASVLSVQPGNLGSVLTVSPGCGLRNFEFDAVFGACSTQRGVYENCGLRLVTDLLNGVNGALVLYGQTSSGKTHTMFGPQLGSDGYHDVHESGLAIRIFDSVLGALTEREKLGVKGQLFVSYIEIFGNDVIDLLSDEALPDRRGVGNVMGHRRVLDGDLGRLVTSPDDLSSLLMKGETRKRKASTKMNERSTRAHTLLILRLLQNHTNATTQEPPVISTLFLADLGGSERVSKSRANEDVKAPGGFVTNGEEVAKISWSEYYRCRTRITETNYINNGLLSLKRCISALSENQIRAAAGRKALPIPFRDSKLTAILEPALGGLARTSIVVCCSSDECNAEETVQTLRFGEICSRIEHVQQVTSDPASTVAKALRALDADISEVEGLIRSKERWEWRQTTRTDVVDANDDSTSKLQRSEVTELGGFGAVEFLPTSGSAIDHQQVEHKVWGQQLVGAEEEHARLEFLLEQRRKLLGEV